jgi:hypothetical protein
LLLDGDFSQKGICPPEFVGLTEGCRLAVDRYLEDRGVRYRMQR